MLAAGRYEQKDSRHRNGLATAMKKMSRICRFYSLWFDAQ